MPEMLECDMKRVALYLTQPDLRPKPGTGDFCHHGAKEPDRPRAYNRDGIPGLNAAVDMHRVGRDAAGPASAALSNARVPGMACRPRSGTFTNRVIALSTPSRIQGGRDRDCGGPGGNMEKRPRSRRRSR
jgi:hypothetical protein